MREKIVNGHQVMTDGRTTWVNAPDGSTVGRFSKWGVDVHRPITEQLKGLPECLDCSHHKPGETGWASEGWVRFVTGVRDNFGVEVPDSFAPAFVPLTTAIRQDDGRDDHPAAEAAISAGLIEA